jgi:DegV family protein with EDD domain
MSASSQRSRPENSVAIITDSSSDLPALDALAAGIRVIPVRAELTVDSSTAMSEVRPAIPQGAAIEACATAFKEALRDHEAVVAVFLSSRLGSVVAAAHAAVEDLGMGERVIVVDSRSASLGLGYQALHAAQLAREGMPARQIADTIRTDSDRYHVAFVVESLEHLRRSGRVGRSAAMIATALQLKPILRIDEGQIVPFERVRLRERAVAELAGFVTDLPDVERCAVLYATNAKDAQELAACIAQSSSHLGVPIDIFHIGDTIAEHVGPNALGIAVVEAESVSE